MKYECDLYEYVPVHRSTYLSPMSTSSTYLVRTIFSQYVLGTYQYVLCLQNYCRGCCFMLNASGKRYCVCVACMLWCSTVGNTKSVPLIVSNIHDIILVRTQYVLSMYWSVLFCVFCTGTYWYVLVRTGTY